MAYEGNAAAPLPVAKLTLPLASYGW